MFQNGSEGQLTKYVRGSRHARHWLGDPLVRRPILRRQGLGSLFIRNHGPTTGHQQLVDHYAIHGPSTIQIKKKLKSGPIVMEIGMPISYVL